MESKQKVRNQIAKRFLLMVSGVAFILLSTAHGKSALMISAALILILCAGIWFVKFPTNVCGPLLPVGSLIINLCLAVIFYQQWGDSPEMVLIASVIGLSSKTLVSICACVGAVVALPFTIFFIDRLLRMQKLSSKWNQWMVSSKAFWFCCLISAIGLLAMIRFAFSKSIELDEAFSLALVGHNYADLIRLTGMDVHPPLYYMILKAVLDGGRLCFPGIPSVYLAK